MKIMEETLKIFNYEGELFDTEIPVSEVEELSVTILSGDEVVTITKTDGHVESFDAAWLAKNPRMMNFYDGSYIVEKDKIREWLQREGSYGWRDY